MKELSMEKKVVVIKLFLNGLSYDDIVQQTGVAKGSVVNIISDFREGNLSLPPGITAYIDTLRQVAVDLRKNSTSVTRLKSYLKIHAKLREMGVDSEQMGQWLEICQSIASSSPNNKFVSAALELAKSMSENGLSYMDLAADYKAKLSELQSVKRETEQQRGELNKITRQKEQAATELDSITRATTTAKEGFHKQQADLKSEQDKYLADNKFSWEKVKLVEAVFKSALQHTGLNEEETERLRRQIVTAGSLIQITRELAEKRNQLQRSIDDLKVYQQHYSDVVGNLAHEREQLEIALKEKQRAKDELEGELDAERAKLVEIKQEVADRIENLYVSRLIIDFLFAPKNISDRDLDRLVSMMVMLKQKRLGIGTEQVTDANGTVVCQCQLPCITTDFEEHEIDIDHARGTFAYFLSPLVRDKFVSRFEYDLAKMERDYSKEIAVLEGKLSDTR